MNSNDQILFDWGLVDKLNPEIIIKQSEAKLVRSFVKMILNTDFQGLSQSSFHSRDVSKLLILFQATIKLLCNSQKQYQLMCNERTKKCNEAAEEIVKLKQNEVNLRKLLHSTQKNQNQGETCPLCKKRFKTMDYLDKHIKNKHIEHFPAWEYFRGITNSLPANNEQNNNEQANKVNSSRDNQQKPKRVQLSFTSFNLVSIQNSLPQKKKAETRPVFELDEEEPQQNNDNDFVINNYIKNQVPPIQKAHAKTPRGNNSFDTRPQTISHGHNLNNQIDGEMTSSQIENIANRAASNIIKDMKEIAQEHQKHYSSPQTPKEKHSNHSKSPAPTTTPTQNIQVQQSSHHARAHTPELGNHAKIESIPTSEQSSHQHKERQHHHQQQPQQTQPNQQPQPSQHHHHHQQQPNQQQQQVQQNQKEISHKQGKRPQTPPGNLDIKKQPTDQQHRPSTTDSILKEPKQQQNPQPQPQVQQTQQIQQTQKPQEASQCDESDPFIIENEEDDQETHEEQQNNSKHVEFTTAQLDDLIPQSEDEDEEADQHSQTPKKKRKKHRKVIQMPEGIIPTGNDTNDQNNINNNKQQQEVKFNFKGTKNENQQNTEQIEMLDENHQKLKMKKPNVTFINDDENDDDTRQNQQHQIQQQPQRKEEVKIGIVKRVDTQPYRPDMYDEDNIQIAREIKNKKEPKNVNRIGGVEISNYELDAIIPSSSFDGYDE